MWWISIWCFGMTCIWLHIDICMAGIIVHSPTYQYVQWAHIWIVDLECYWRHWFFQTAKIRRTCMTCFLCLRIRWFTDEYLKQHENIIFYRRNFSHAKLSRSIVYCVTEAVVLAPYGMVTTPFLPERRGHEAIASIARCAYPIHMCNCASMGEMVSPPSNVFMVLSWIRLRFCLEWFVIMMCTSQHACTCRVHVHVHACSWSQFWTSGLCTYKYMYKHVVGWHFMLDVDRRFFEGGVCNDVPYACIHH